MCFDYDLKIPSHGISKIFNIENGIKSSKMICGQDGIICPHNLERLTQEMRSNKIFGQDSRNIRGRVLDDFLHTSILT